jgi:hypothetical protein
MAKRDVEIHLTPKQFADLINDICESITGEAMVDDIKRSQAALSEFLEETGPDEIRDMFRRMGCNMKGVSLKIEITTEKEVVNKPKRMLRVIETDS